MRSTEPGPTSAKGRKPQAGDAPLAWFGKGAKLSRALRAAWAAALVFGSPAWAAPQQRPIDAAAGTPARNGAASIGGPKIPQGHVTAGVRFPIVPAGALIKPNAPEAHRPLRLASSVGIADRNHRATAAPAAAPKSANVKAGGAPRHVTREHASEPKPPVHAKPAAPPAANRQAPSSAPVPQVRDR